ncbi:sirohydrochlorin cobaltochelatase [Clostridium chrysemydis]|uniref:sirohydrochlorin cobaltochelatase n=1 Tax=Clostridium chrysemydis TaxID=2665504 RepID=UPI0018835241|nr:sirohydrochlorin cobaltochelatase [Clostridium chrysemydis]
MRKAIIIVSFGSSDVEGLKKSIFKAEENIRKQFEDFDVFRAFTSNIIIKKLRENTNISISNLDEKLKFLKESNYDKVIIQPLNIISGKEYNKIKEEFYKYKNNFDTLILGDPLFLVKEGEVSTNDLNRFNIFLETILKSDKNILLFGHGSSSESDIAYKKMQEFFDINNKNNIFVGTLEGDLSIEKLILKFKDKDIKRVKIYPLMLTCGMHVKKDLASEDEKSWKSKLEGAGIEVEIIQKGLTELDDFNKIYIDKINLLIDEYKTKNKE